MHGETFSTSRRTTLAVTRFAQGLTQRSLAERAGVSRQTVVRLEAGACPSVRTATAIAQALGYADPSLVFPEAFTP